MGDEIGESRLVVATPYRAAETQATSGTGVARRGRRESDLSLDDLLTIRLRRYKYRPVLQDTDMPEEGQHFFLAEHNG